MAQAETVEPKVAARGWALTDLASGGYLAGEDASERLPMGSTDKIMVALVALEQAEAGQANLGEEVTVSTDAAAFAVPFYSNVGLLAGEVVGVRKLLAATLIPSGNDAVYALAKHLGGGRGEAGVDKFVEKMNQRARALGLEDTHFQNPTGLAALGQYSGAGISRPWRGRPPRARSSARWSPRTTPSSPPKTGR